MAQVRERVARITLNRPERRNALSWEMLSELRAALLEADDLRAVSVIVLVSVPPRGTRPKSVVAGPATVADVGAPNASTWPSRVPTYTRPS